MTDKDDELAQRAREYVKSLNRNNLYCFDLIQFTKAELEKFKEENARTAQ